MDFFLSFFSWVGWSKELPDPPYVPHSPFFLTPGGTFHIHKVEAKFLHNNILSSLKGLYSVKTSTNPWIFECYNYNSTGFYHFFVNLYTNTNGNIIIEVSCYSHHNNHKMYCRPNQMILDTISSPFIQDLITRGITLLHPPSSSCITNRVISPIMPVSRDANGLVAPQPINEYVEQFPSTPFFDDNGISLIRDLRENLLSDYEDVCTPTACSMASLAGQCGILLSNTFADYVTKCTEDPCNIPQDNLTIKLVSLLISRVIDRPKGTTSIVCRTFLAIALSELSLYPQIAKCLVMFNAPTLLLNAFKELKHMPTAENSRLRLELVKTVLSIISKSQNHLERSNISSAENRLFLTTHSNDEDIQENTIIREILSKIMT
jgi:hypothetical protein